MGVQSLLGEFGRAAARSMTVSRHSMTEGNDQTSDRSDVDAEQLARDAASAGQSDAGDSQYSAMTEELRQETLAMARVCFDEARDAQEADAVLARPEDVTRVGECIGQVAHSLRMKGVSPEQTIIIIKEIIAEAAPRTIARRALLQDGVQWAIRAYYRAG